VTVIYSRAELMINYREQIHTVLFKIIFAQQ